MKAKTWFEKKLEQFENDFDFRMESIILDITEKICEKMEQKNINRAEFAKVLGVSRPAVTKILNGSSNFTLRTLLSIADALELNLAVQFEEKETVSTAETSVYFKKISSDAIDANTAPFLSEDYSYERYPEPQKPWLKSYDADSGGIMTGGQI